MYTTQICSKCKEECGVVYEIDAEPYEFWGEKGVHKFEYQFSDCCRAELEELITLEEGDSGYGEDAA
jgi:hypothetical protein